MKVLAFNGSPRKEWNTATLVKEALAGAKSKGVQTELVHLYDLDYKGCTSCFACKLIGGKSYGRCAMRDGLTPFLKKVEEADALVLASPIYLGTATGEMRSCLERLLFPFYTYTDPPRSLLPKKLRVALIYTFGAPEELARQRRWDRSLAGMDLFLAAILGEVRSQYCFDTTQFDDYAKYEASRFDPALKAKQRAEVFPLDRQKAFELGVWLAGN
jgi:multimeric flavodoxin WrbA